MYEKMRKSLGDKRNEISDEQINEIVSMYNQTKESKHVKIFNNEDLGYYRVSVERPLRLNFKITEERLQALDDERAFKNLATSRKRNETEKEDEIDEGKQKQEQIKEHLREMISDKIYKNHEEINEVIKDAFKK